MNKQQGLSLIELMVAILISSILLLGALELFSNTSATDKTNTALARIQESGRLALELIGADARRAGYQGCSSSSNTLTLSNNLTFPAAALSTSDKSVTFRYATTANTGTGFSGNKNCAGDSLFLTSVAYNTCTSDGVSRICKTVNGGNASPILSHASITTVQFGVPSAGLLSWIDSAAITQTQLNAAQAIRVTLSISDARNEITRSFVGTYDLRNRL